MKKGEKPEPPVDLSLVNPVAASQAFLKLSRDSETIEVLSKELGDEHEQQFLKFGLNFVRRFYKAGVFDGAKGPMVLKDFVINNYFSDE